MAVKKTTTKSGKSVEVKEEGKPKKCVRKCSTKKVAEVKVEKEETKKKVAKAVETAAAKKKC